MRKKARKGVQSKVCLQSSAFYTVSIVQVNAKLLVHKTVGCFIQTNKKFHKIGDNMSKTKILIIED